MMNEAERLMLRALDLAKRGEGAVAPNPMVGCVIERDGRIIAEGYHQMYGGPHAEVNALNSIGNEAPGATVYVTLEPCAHFGKNPPCTLALITAGVSKVVVAMRDPNPLVNGKGIDELRRAGIEVVEMVLESQARELNAPYITRFEQNRPWIVAKWAMTLDGKIATRTGSSQWISSEDSRSIVQKLRSKVDAIMIGSSTARLDDPSLTVRVFEDTFIAGPRMEMGIESENESKGDSKVTPGESLESPARRLTDTVGSKIPLRIVLDSSASISLQSRLVQTAKSIPVLIGVGLNAPEDKMDALRKAGCEVLVFPFRLHPESTMENERMRDRDFRPGTIADREQPASLFPDLQWGGNIEIAQLYRERLVFLFANLVKRGITSLLVEGGGVLLGSLFDAKMIDEVHVFIAPKLVGGRDAAVPIGGNGFAEMEQALLLDKPFFQPVGPDIYVSGKIKRTVY